MNSSRALGLLLFTVAPTQLLGCGNGGATSSGDGELRQTEVRAFTNGGFETGTAGAVPPTPWVVTTFLNSTGITVQTPQTRAGLDLAVGGKVLTFVETAASPESTPDLALGTAATFRYPRYGNNAAVVNTQSSTNYTTGGTTNGKNVNVLSQTMILSAADVDPSDAKIHVRFVDAAVLQNPAHTASQQPYYMVQLTNTTTGALVYSDFAVVNSPGPQWNSVNGGTTNEIDYFDWSLVDITPGPTVGAMSLGDQVRLDVVVAGCSPGGHFGEVYIDGVSAVGGLFVFGSAPAQIPTSSPLTYSLTYENGGTSSASGAVIDFTTPPGTTFVSVSPPLGAVCTTPVVGSSGIVVCTFTGPVAAGSGGTLSVTVTSPATAQLLGEQVYDIKSSSETALLGSKILTQVGCSADSQCSAGDWCDISAGNCTATLANGTALPSDTGHTSPTLDGSCTSAAATLVCASGVCDTKDSKCGYDLGDGSCIAGTAPSSGVAVCRSGACSTTGTCEPSGGCHLDADCATGSWCDEATQVCTARLANASPLPTDPTHVSPTLDGSCTTAAATLVCASGVCDTTDSKCGYAGGDGSCTADAGATSGAVVCRSGICSANGACEPPGGCNVDADCTTAQWCNETAHTCAGKLADGTALPSDPAHTDPALTGACTAAVGALICTSGVCSTNGTCGAPPAADAGTDAGSIDAGTVADAGDEVDATAPSADASVDSGLDAAADGGIVASGGDVDGGGCSVARGSRSAESPWLELLVGLGLALVSRRRRSE